MKQHIILLPLTKIIILPSGPDAQASIAKYLSSYPLTGKTKLRVMLEKQNLRGYHIKGVSRFDEGAGRQSFELLFDAEGKRQDISFFT